MVRDEVPRTTQLWRSTNDGSKTQTSHMKVLLECGAAKSLCGAKPVALMALTCAREGKTNWRRARHLKESMRAITSEELEIKMSVHS